MTLRPILAAPMLALLSLAACATQETVVPRAPVAAAAPAPAPPRPAPAVDAPIERASARPVFFDIWSAQMTDETRAALTELAERAKSEPARRLLVVGHAAPGGSGEANALLARLRARVVADVLTEAGLPSNRVRVTYRVPVQGTEAVESRRVDVRLDDAAPAPRGRR